MCCMKCLPLCAPCPFHLLSCSSVASSPTRGNPVTGTPHLSTRSTRSRSPHLLACLAHVSAIFPFAPDSQRVTGTDMLPWHHFRIVAVAPFSFHHGDDASYHLLVNLLIKLH